MAQQIGQALGVLQGLVVGVGGLLVGGAQSLSPLAVFDDVFDLDHDTVLQLCCLARAGGKRHSGSTGDDTVQKNSFQGVIVLATRRLSAVKPGKAEVSASAGTTLAG